jgi:hypothetical protein
MSGRLTVALAAAAVLCAPSAFANTLVYNTTTLTGTLGTYPGDLVESFTVNQAGLDVVDLAVFDSQANPTGRTHAGITTNLMVGLFNDTTDTVAIAAVNFNGIAYNGTGGSYFVTKAVAPYTLINGDTYSIEAWGFNSTDEDLYNGGNPAVTFNSLGGALTNISGASSATGHTATNIDGNSTGGLINAISGNTEPYTGTQPGYPNPCFQSTNCTTDNPILRFNGTDTFAAGSLVVSPLPAAFPLFLTGLGAMGMLGRRRKRKNAAIAAA